MKSWIKSVQEFIHEPVDVRTVASVRVGYALLMLINVACWWPDLERWFSDSGVMTLSASRQAMDSYSLTVFQILPNDVATVRTVYAIFVVQLIALLIGWRPRLQAVCCYIWLVSFQHRNSLLFEGEDTLFRIVGFLLNFMPLDSAWSLSHKPQLPAGVQSTLTDGWPIRLLQFEMTMLYFSAAWNKLLGAPWRDGSALYYVMRLDEYWGRFPLPSFLVDAPWIVRTLTWATLGLEFSVPVLIWFAPTRRLALGLVLAFHLSCDYAMHLFLFHWIMLVGWMSFLKTEDFEAIRKLFTRSVR